MTIPVDRLDEIAKELREIVFGCALTYIHDESNCPDAYRAGDDLLALASRLEVEAIAARLEK